MSASRLKWLLSVSYNISVPAKAGMTRVGYYSAGCGIPAGIALSHSARARGIIAKAAPAASPGSETVRLAPISAASASLT